MAPINFGVLMIPYQTIDAAMPLDVLSSCSKSMMEACQSPEAPEIDRLLPHAIDINFFHINETLEPVELTAGFKVVPTTTIKDCPPLDYLLVGGPIPTYQLPESFKSFIRAHVEAGKGLFTTCTGAVTVAQTGILDGKKATVNHTFIEHAKKYFPNVNWTIDAQWVIDGNIWTAGGACAGMDMMASWVMGRVEMDLAKFAFEVLDYEPRDVRGDRVLPQQHHHIVEA
ncbi:putative dj-1 family protein [Botrytis fragariae]|uniref:Putative dj-1 family protein n=1 Tax=Botrytis fragariae TaxID=1964551 RepID=A0A8H6B416_9HELO|nr:putative dj-1 family protein [Botrytis fragariae]KAF5878994.1 putative dj-1 family protein [Botrytis fragariae]